MKVGDDNNMAICGIYKITEKSTGKVYIGQSIDIFRRWEQHQQNLAEDEWHNKLYFFTNNFTFEILEECDKSLLNEREAYYIKQYDSFNKGFNKTEGNIYSIEKKENTFFMSTTVEWIDDSLHFSKHIYKAINTPSFKKTISLLYKRKPDEYYVSHALLKDKDTVLGAFISPIWKNTPYGNQHLFYLAFTSIAPYCLELNDFFKQYLADVIAEETNYASTSIFYIRNTGGYKCQYIWHVNVLEKDKTVLHRFNLENLT